MTGNLLDLDDMLSAPQTSGPAGLGGIDLGGVSAPNMQAQADNNDMGFGFGSDP